MSETRGIRPRSSRFYGSAGALPPLRDILLYKYSGARRRTLVRDGESMGQGTDVFIVGGGPAGLAAAIAARTKGFRVIVADGAKPPITKACGEGMLPDALKALSELGVELRETDGGALRGIRFGDERSSVSASFPNGHGIGVRREILHQRMLERARDCGVCLLWNTPVMGLDKEGVVAG